MSQVQVSLAGHGASAAVAPTPPAAACPVPCHSEAAQVPLLAHRGCLSTASATTFQSPLLRTFAEAMFVLFGPPDFSEHQNATLTANVKLKTLQFPTGTKLSVFRNRSLRDFEQPCVLQMKPLLQILPSARKEKTTKCSSALHRRREKNTPLWVFCLTWRRPTTAVGVEFAYPIC